MKQISVSNADVAKQSNSTNNAPRPSRAKIISFFKKDGTEITNAEVVRVVDGVSLIYRTGPTSMGMIRLEDLPEDLRNQFGYDPEKTAAADQLAAQQKTYWQQQMLAAQQAQAQQAQAAAYSTNYVASENYSGGYGSYSSSRYSSDGSHYVQGYYRKMEPTSMAIIAVETFNLPPPAEHPHVSAMKAGQCAPV